MCHLGWSTSQAEGASCKKSQNLVACVGRWIIFRQARKRKRCLWHMWILRFVSVSTENSQCFVWSLFWEYHRTLFFFNFLLLTLLQTLLPPPHLWLPSPSLHSLPWPSPPCCLCPWAMHVCSLANHFTFCSLLPRDSLGGFTESWAS